MSETETGTETFQADLTIGQSAIDAYSRMSYTMWFALAEFLDNSTQSRLNHGGIINDVLASEGQPLTIDVLHKRDTKQLLIADNSIGMNLETLVASLKIASPTPDSKGRSKYGMGMKTAACWIGRRWQIVTTEWGSGQQYTAEIDVDAIAHHGARVPITVQEVDKDLHGTTIIISDLRRVIQKRSEEVIRAYLGSMYMFDLRPDTDGKIALKLTYNGEEVPPPEDLPWDIDAAGAPMKKLIPETLIGGHKVTGWFGILKKGGRKYGGFSLYQNERQIQGYPDGWKPRAIFGGVDDEGANNLVAQRLTGVLLLDGFEISHAKDKVLFQGDEEDELEKFLVAQTQDYVTYAKNRRGTKGGGIKWSKEKLRDLVESMKSEFTGNEMKDALNSAALPPAAVIEASNQKVVAALTLDDELSRFEILPDLHVIISETETSEYEPYVIFTPMADGKTLHIVVNLLHPYYQMLGSDAAIDECVKQYVFDAVSEFKVGKLFTKTNPNSVRTLKDSLLRARVTGVENQEAAQLQQAQLDLNGDDGPLANL